MCLFPKEILGKAELDKLCGDIRATGFITIWGAKVCNPNPSDMAVSEDGISGMDYKSLPPQ